jgi:hypothetical protein
MHRAPAAAGQAGGVGLRKGALPAVAAGWPSITAFDSLRAAQAGATARLALEPVSGRGIDGGVVEEKPAAFRSFPAWFAVLFLSAVGVQAALTSTSRFTLRELEVVPTLTPKQFGNLFENFRYSYCPYVLPVEDFLNYRAGDCDDYAILADHVLSKKGFETRIIRVALAGSDVAHAICYVTENKAYLDYNNRKYSVNLERAGPTLRQIAAKVAASFEKNWTSATEYTFSYATNRKTTRFTVVKTDPPAQDPDRVATR